MNGGLGSFDASQFAPKQGGVAHPVGIFDFTITDTKIIPTGVDKDNPQGTGGTFAVEFTSPAGSIINRYNLWNSNAQTVEIAHGQLSALCHVTGIMRLDFNCPANMAGAALRNARGKMEIVQQIDKDTKQPTQYVQLRRVMDINGNEPGKAPVANAAQPQQQQPMQQTANGGWAQPTQPTQAAQGQPQQTAAPQWGQNQPAAPQTNQQAPQGGWQPGNNAPGGTAPWAR